MTTMIDPARAGTPEAGTELPANSVPSKDAASEQITQAQAEAQTIAAIQAQTVDGVVAEGDEIRGRKQAEEPSRRGGSGESFATNANRGKK